jgi:formate dehydrogenase maturation protein FdhE
MPEKTEAMTPEQARVYLKEHGHLCPFCGMPDVEGNKMEFDLAQISQQMSCANCGQHWWDVYTLTGVCEYGGTGEIIASLKVEELP